MIMRSKAQSSVGSCFYAVIHSETLVGGAVDSTLNQDRPFWFLTKWAYLGLAVPEDGLFGILYLTASSHLIATTKQ